MTPSAEHPQKPDPPRFVADHMLAGTVRKLRLLGYDCESAVPGGPTGATLIQWARTQRRRLLTTSRTLAELDPETVHTVPNDNPKEQIRWVTQRWPLDFRRTLFTRCSLCNTPIEPIDREQVLDRLPAKVREGGFAITWCPTCDHLYWEGTHVEALRRAFSKSLDLETL